MARKKSKRSRLEAREAAKLAGHSDGYRVRQGDYRVAHSVDDALRVILVVKVGHRREVYRRPT